MLKPALLTAALLFILGCKTTKVPTVKYPQLQFPYPVFSVKNNNIEIALRNPVDCPLRLWFKSQDANLQNEFNRINPIQLKEKSDTTLTLSGFNQLENSISCRYRLGSVSKDIDTIKLGLPFPIGKEYRVIQGNNTNHTHNTDWSRYAIDFNLQTNDTICSATSGFVVGVIDKYKFGGKGDKWKPFGNFITLYEPNSGIFTQYVHLVENGSFVKVGDRIERGQPIALSGNTGQTDMEHLHFNCLVPADNEDGLISIPFEFIGGYKSEELKKNDLVKNTRYPDANK